MLRHVDEELIPEPRGADLCQCPSTPEGRSLLSLSLSLGSPAEVTPSLSGSGANSFREATSKTCIPQQEDPAAVAWHESTCPRALIPLSESTTSTRDPSLVVASWKHLTVISLHLRMSASMDSLETECQTLGRQPDPAPCTGAPSGAASHLALL